MFRNFSPYDRDDEPTEAEHAQALARFRAARGRYPGVAAEFRRARLAETEADYPDGQATAAEPRRRERAGVEM